MKKLKLQNLDCANCALKIEKTLNNMTELSNVRLNFSTSTLTFEQNIDKDLSDLIEKEMKKNHLQVKNQEEIAIDFLQKKVKLHLVVQEIEKQIQVLKQQISSKNI